MTSVPSPFPPNEPVEGAAAPAPVPDTLARELHDSVAHILNRMVLDLERFHLDPKDPYLAAERVERMEVAGHQALRDLRQVLDELGAAPGPADDVVPRLWTLMRRLESETGIHASLRISPAWPARLGARTALQLLGFMEE